MARSACAAPPQAQRSRSRTRCQRGTRAQHFERNRPSGANRRSKRLSHRGVRGGRRPARRRAHPSPRCVNIFAFELVGVLQARTPSSACPPLRHRRPRLRKTAAHPRDATHGVVARKEPRSSARTFTLYLSSVGVSRVMSLHRTWPPRLPRRARVKALRDGHCNP